MLNPTLIDIITAEIIKCGKTISVNQEGPGSALDLSSPVYNVTYFDPECSQIMANLEQMNMTLLDTLRTYAEKYEVDQTMEINITSDDITQVINKINSNQGISSTADHSVLRSFSDDDILLIIKSEVNSLLVDNIHIQRITEAEVASLKPLIEMSQPVIPDKETVDSTKYIIYFIILIVLILLGYYLLSGENSADITETNKLIEAQQYLQEIAQAQALPFPDVGLE